MRVRLLFGTVLAVSLLFGAYAPGPTQALDTPDCGKAAVASSTSVRFLDCNPDYSLAVDPAQDPGLRFKLSQKYPDPAATLPAEDQPWMAFNPFERDLADTDGSQQWSQADQYLRAVLKYAFKDNTDVDFDVQQHEEDPAKRQWYHTPGLHFGCFGREFVHGLTRERQSESMELHPDQVKRVDNWAVGFYNAPGGQVVKKVWADPKNINLLNASFPDGTVSFKLLFTTADLTTDERKVPTLVGSPVWQAHIFSNDITSNAVRCASTTKREIGEVRLMQVDVAVRDSRARSVAGIETNWAFGTFIYDGTITVPVSEDDPSPSTGWTNIEKRLVPVGLTWGTDPDADTNADRTFSGTTATYNPTLRESLINPCVITSERPGRSCENTAVVQHLGLGGRLNGPIDNPRSACMSCHGRSGITPTEDGNDEEFFIRSSANPVPTAVFGYFYANIPSGAQIATAVVSPSPTVIATVVRPDYSLQIRQGVELCMENNDPANPECGILALPGPAPVPAPAPAVVSTPGSRNRITRDIP